MHPLQRPPCPACLASFRHGLHNWSKFHARAGAAQEVREALEAMQHGQCAYCEAPLNDSWHIEHFWPRGTYPQKTFDWNNLYGSCRGKDRCGTYKDQGGRPYEPSDLIDPCSDDPDDFLFFAVDGTVQPKEGLTPHALRRAEETIRVFNLNAPALRRQRQQTVRTLLSAEPDVLDVLAEFEPEDRWVWVQDLIDDYCAGCFPTPLRHLLCVGAP